MRLCVLRGTKVTELRIEGVTESLVMAEDYPVAVSRSSKGGADETGISQVSIAVMIATGSELLAR